MKTSTHSREFLSGVPYRSSRTRLGSHLYAPPLGQPQIRFNYGGNGVLLLPDTITTIPFQSHSEHFNTQILFNYGGIESFFHLIQLQQFHSSPTVSTSVLWAGIFNTMGAGNRAGIGLSLRPARLNRLAEFISWNRFLGSINVLKIRALSG